MKKFISIPSRYVYYTWRKYQWKDNFLSWRYKWIHNNNNRDVNGRCQFSSKKFIPDDRGMRKSEKDNLEQEDKKPKVIQITKEQYLQMRKFLQDINLSMPPQVLKSIKAVSSHSSQQQNQKNSDKQQQNPKEARITNYFSSPQQILSFKLLKLSQPQQFTSIFEQHKSSQHNIKVLILYRYCCVGGIINKYKLSHSINVNNLAYDYMQDTLKNMKNLQQNILQQFLQLYLTIAKGLLSEVKEIEQDQLQNIKYHGKCLKRSEEIQSNGNWIGCTAVDLITNEEEYSVVGAAYSDVGTEYSKQKQLTSQLKISKIIDQSTRVLLTSSK